MANTTSITHISTPAEHDVVVSEAESQPTIICLVNSVTPVCKAFIKRFEETAARQTASGVRFCLMEFNNQTSMMFKFAINQLPVVVFMCAGPWSRSVVGATQRDLEVGIEGLLDEVRKTQNRP
ncbi:hypothetical protein LTR10_012815 [Elasticomyces elasticus]|nr:hypothetical protein LTR10_012815 [Elasticomyces elasticus]KAK4978763.1 hypothetical protein LTR42_001263 [Elasticomyces elasticus]